METFLCYFATCLVIGVNIGANTLAKKAIVANSTEEYNYYNIYSKIDTLEKDLQSLETRMQRMQKKKTLLKQVVQTINEMDDNLGLPDKNLKNKNLQTQKQNAVGFTARISGSYSRTSSIIRVYRILYNGGNAYNGTVFTCPSSGLYLFHVTLLTQTKDGGIWICKNSQKLTLAYAGRNPQLNGGSASAAVWLDVGDQVFLHSYPSSLSVDSSSSFTGVKVN